AGPARRGPAPGRAPARPRPAAARRPGGAVVRGAGARRPAVGTGRGPAVGAADLPRHRPQQVPHRPAAPRVPARALPAPGGDTGPPRSGPRRLGAGRLGAHLTPRARRATAVTGPVDGATATAAPTARTAATPEEARV